MNPQIPIRTINLITFATTSRILFSVCFRRRVAAAFDFRFPVDGFVDFRLYGLFLVIGFHRFYDFIKLALSVLHEGTRLAVVSTFVSKSIQRVIIQ